MATEQRIREAARTPLNDYEYQQIKTIVDRLERDGHMPMAGLEADVVLWGRRTFPGASPRSILAHLKEEVAELEATLASDHLSPDDKTPAEECADIALLLTQIAWAFDTTLEGEMSRKHAINKTRTWRYFPELGYSKAVEPADEGAPDAGHA